jgi:membrane protein implicated in regulation of membrane protease activity
MLLSATNTGLDIFLIVWVVVIIATIIGELLTADLSCIWFTGGGVIALILSLCGVSNPYIQIGAFLLVSLILLFTLGRLARKNMNSNITHTNIDAAIGKEILVLKDADAYHYGEGKYAGLVWTIACLKDEEVKKDEFVFIKAVEGNKLIVSRNKD